MSISYMLAKLAKRNHKKHVNIWLKPSSVKLGKEKTTLLEFVVLGRTSFMFTHRKTYSLFKKDPIEILKFLETQESFEGMMLKIKEDQFFYLNGNKVMTLSFQW